MTCGSRWCAWREALFRVTALRREPANEAGVCCGPPGGLSAVAEVSVLHRLLGWEASAGRVVVFRGTMAFMCWAVPE